MPLRPPRPDLDAAVDAHVRQATDVTSWEEWSRRRTLARLAEPERPGREAPRREAHRPMVRPFAWLAVAAALVTMVALTWVAHRPEPPRRPLLAARTAVPQSSAGAPPVSARRPLPLPPVQGVVSSASHGPRRGGVAASTAIVDDRPDALGAVIRAVRQLPPEVWDRVEKAGPPAPLPELDVGELSTAPLSIDPLPSGDWSSNPSLLPGGPR